MNYGLGDPRANEDRSCDRLPARRDPATRAQALFFVFTAWVALFCIRLLAKHPPQLAKHPRTDPRGGTLAVVVEPTTGAHLHSGYVGALIVAVVLRAN